MYVSICSSHVGLRLREAQELQEFLRAGEDELVWMREAEALLSNEDLGRDLQGVRFLLKKHQVCREETGEGSWREGFRCWENIKYVERKGYVNGEKREALERGCPNDW